MATLLDTVILYCTQSTKTCKRTLRIRRKRATNSYNKTNQMRQFFKFIFGIELYMFRIGFLSIIESSTLYKQ